MRGPIPLDNQPGIRKSGKRPLPRREGGIALVLTLAALVLITVLLVAFFSKAQLQRQIAFSSTSQARTETLAHAVTGVIVGELRQEIVDGSHPVSPAPGQPAFYQPKTNADAFPKKMGRDATLTPADAAFTTIVKVSAEGIKLRDSGTMVGSDVEISEASANGRTIGANKWFGPSGPQLGTQSTLPTWLYMTRNDGVANPDPADARNKNSDRYVVGRFAYTIYDVSGRLNANVAGYPSTAASVGLEKGTVASADLSVLDSAFTPTATGTIDTFIKWRNGVTDTASAAAYTKYLTEQSQSGGFLSTKLGHNAFVSRKDLIHSASASASILPSSSVLPLLTHFTATQTAPSWRPRKNSPEISGYPTSGSPPQTKYRDLANDPASYNRDLSGVHRPTDETIIRYRDDGTSESIEVAAGDPLVTSRFSLAKLAWLAHDGPDMRTRANGGSFEDSLSAAERTAAIRACFGLVWHPNTKAASDANTSNAYWEFVDHKPSPGRAIYTLEQISQLTGSAARDPNFFELLRAGILTGSLGQAPGLVAPWTQAPNAPGPTDREGPIGNVTGASEEPNRHIMQIGVNMIDQADADDFPTAIRFELFSTNAGDPESDLAWNIVYGIEDLPYLHKLFGVSYQDSTDGKWKAWVQPELWNPHQAPVAAPPAGQAPTAFRVRAYGRARANWSFNAQNSVTNPANSGKIPEVNYNAGNLHRDIYFTNANLFRDVPVPLTLGNIDRNRTPAENRPSPSTYTAHQPSAWDVGTATNDTTGFAGIYVGSVNYLLDPARKCGVFHYYAITPSDSVTYAMEYFDGTDWHPYSLMSHLTTTMRGNITRRSETGSDASTAIPAPFDGRVEPNTRNPIHGPDPRTDRFSSTLSTSWSEGETAEPRLAVTPPYKAVQNSYADSFPRRSMGFTYTGVTLTTPQTSQSFSIAAWAFMLNMPTLPTSHPSTAAGVNAYYNDADGVVRPADGLRSNISTGDGCYLLGPTAATGSAKRRRPNILNRPYQSIGELGYVYRDLPGKNLDLWSESSADAALLDLFSLQEEPAVTAATFNPNAADSSILKSMLIGSSLYRDTAAASDPKSLSAADAQSLATAFLTQFQNGNYLALREDLAVELGSEINAAMAALPNSGSKGVAANKASAEAPVRALAGSSNPRTWNLLIDVVVQTGQMTPNASTLKQFIVNGECRYWVHLALDRYTGKVVSQQMEPVYD